MRTVMVRYKVKAEAVAENERLIAAVFAQLARDKPAGVRYQALKLPDGQGFVHFAMSEANVNPVTQLEAFKQYTAGIKDRCEELPVSTVVQQVGLYDGLA
ncbi:hypothetical protein [Caenimonas aquaedulcis]|uniref:ABM domain-containing protein n=1 Tax=Caenimonas aquaedulcis TaxID=2793270 RepID=A0A931H5X9_9BURK|nr:hypothetical protein [Caenimonas aquaedulcis]MBG9389010.1 hypothetical protein [Caenimonas aquaedulcis]